VAAEFTRIAKAAGIEGRAFYDLRRTFQTIAEGTGDIVAVRRVVANMRLSMWAR
jgi:hypothetical protein